MSDKDRSTATASDEAISTLFIGSLIVIIAGLVLPIILISLPLAIMLKKLLDDEKALFRYVFGLLLGCIFYTFIFGINDNFAGLVFKSFGNELRYLFDELMALKPKSVKFYPDFPNDVRLYFWFTYFAAIVMSVVLKIKDKKKNLSSREVFARKHSTVFSNIIKFLTVVAIPYYVAARLIVKTANKWSSNRLRLQLYCITSMIFFYIFVYLIFGQVFSWHIKFGLFLNKSVIIFKVISPWFVDLVKQYFYLGAVIFPLVFINRKKDFELHSSDFVQIVGKNRSKIQNGVYLGKDQNSKPIFLNNQTLNHHVHVVGASGFGKTTLLLNIIKEKIDAFEGIIFVDLKGDIDTICELTTFVKNAGRIQDFEFFSISEDFLEVSNGLSLFKNGNALEIKDKIMGAFKYGHDYYKKRVESFLNLSLRALVHLRDTRGRGFDLESIYKLILGFEHIEDLASQIDDEYIKSDLKTMIVDKNLKDDLTGLKADIEGLIKTDFGHLISGEDGINFYESIRDSKIVYIHLDSQRYEVSAEKLGRIILQDIKTASAKIITGVPKEGRKHFTLIVDEFANLATEQFVGFLNRARASGIGIVIAHQELSDLDVFSPVVKDQIMTNTSTLFSFLQKLPKSAEIIAGIGGTVTTEKETTQFDENGLIFKTKEKTGMGSIREVEEYVVHPNLIKELGRGECFMISKYPYTRIAKVFVNYLDNQFMSKYELIEMLKQLNKFTKKELIDFTYNNETNEDVGRDWL